MIKVATNAQMARLLYALGDTLLEGTARSAGVPAPVLQTFVEGTAVGTADMVKKKKKGKKAVSRLQSSIWESLQASKGKNDQKER